jgi:hypothetical protein
MRSENYDFLYCEVFPALPLLPIRSVKPRNCGSIPRKGERFLFFLSVHKGSNVHLASRSIGTGELHPGIKRPELEAYHSTSPSVKVTDMCRYKSIQLCAYETRARDHLTLITWIYVEVLLPITRYQIKQSVEGEGSVIWVHCDGMKLSFGAESFTFHFSIQKY